MKLFTALVLTLTFGMAASLANAGTLESPQGSVILTVSGAIENTNGDGVARFDKAMLEALQQRTTETATPWHEGVVSFEGPLGSALLDAVGASGETMQVTAINDYSAEVPVSDFYDHEVILALKADGKYMRVRDKGPLFIIYPFDEKPELSSEIIHNRSVWQIKAIDIK
ncbi:hypothetical protein [Marinobacterium lutimaris]|uniref:Oxidoreductase molybdopterin-binding domain-containing protein n=1 Tax=Marinobacterium lutimaris TaxID=568106 RepID=A0A1H6DLU9_9GAMM|nr:hypothetical protein [Marinobacterium lutimaris]SEG85833.1 hypothetical protein SAMN05444390_10749 [Marinobacterium lutimaris]